MAAVQPGPAAAEYKVVVVPAGTASFTEEIKRAGCIPWGKLGMTINKNELAVNNDAGAFGIKLLSQQTSTRVTTDKINFVQSQIGSRSPTVFFLILVVSYLLIFGLKQEEIGGIFFVVGMLLWWFLNDSMITFGAHNMTISSWSTTAQGNQSGLWLSKLGSGTDGGAGAGRFFEEATEAMYLSHGLVYTAGTKPEGDVYKRGSFMLGCIKSGSHDISFCNQHLDCVQTEGLFAIPAVSQVLRTRFFAKDVRFTRQHKPGRSVAVLLGLMVILYVIFMLTLAPGGFAGKPDGEPAHYIGAIGAILGAVYWWFNIQPWIMFNIGGQGKAMTMQTPFSGVPKIQERLDTVVLGRAPSQDIIETYKKKAGKGEPEYKLELTPDQLIVTDKVPGFCGLQACSQYDKWIAPLKDIDYVHSEISSTTMYFWIGLLGFILFMIPYPEFLGKNKVDDNDNEMKDEQGNNIKTGNVVVGLVWLIIFFILFLLSRAGSIEVGVLPAGDRTKGMHTTSFHIPFKPSVETSSEKVCQVILEAHMKARLAAGNHVRVLGQAV